MRIERCYHFTKSERLPTTALLFPEAMDLIKGEQANTTSQRAATILLAGIKGPIVHSLHQRQLINISRYRNILRYQLGRSANQPLIDEPTTTATSISKLANTNTKQKGHRKKKGRKLAGRQLERLDKNGTESEAKDLNLENPDGTTELEAKQHIGERELAIGSFSNFSAIASAA